MVNPHVVVPANTPGFTKQAVPGYILF